MERSANENRNKTSEDGVSGSSKESSRSSSKDKQRSSSAPKEKEGEKSVQTPSHSRTPKNDTGISSKSHQKSSSKSKDEKGASKSSDDAQKSGSSHRSKEDSKSSHTKHKSGETKHSDSKSSHRSSKEKSESPSKQSHRSSSKDDGKASSRHGHRSEHKSSSSSSKATGGEEKIKHSDKLPAKDSIKVNPSISTDTKSSRSHASQKDSQVSGVDESKSSKGHEHAKSSSGTKSRESSKHSHRSSSKSEKTSSDKSKDKSQKDSKKSDSQRTRAEKDATSDSKSGKPDETSANKGQTATTAKKLPATDHPPDAAASKYKPSSQIKTSATPEVKQHDRDRSKSKRSSTASAEIVTGPGHQHPSEKSSNAKTLFSSKNNAPQSDKIVYNREGTKSTTDNKLKISKTDSKVTDALHASGKITHRQETKVPEAKRSVSTSKKETGKRARSSPSTTEPRDSKRSKLDVPETKLRQEDNSSKERLGKDTEANISGSGAKSDLYVSVKLAAIKRKAPGGKFQVEGLTPKGGSTNRSQTKRSVHFGGVQKFYIERRKKVRFAKVVATYKWPLSRKIKFVKLKKSIDCTKSKKVHKRKKVPVPAVDKKQKKKSTAIKSKENKHTASDKKSISWQEKNKTQKNQTGTPDKIKPLRSSKNIKPIDPQKTEKSKTPKRNIPSSTDSVKSSVLQKHDKQLKAKGFNDNLKPKTDKILPSVPETSKTDKSGKPSVSEMKLKKDSAKKTSADNKKAKPKSKKGSKGKSKTLSKLGTTKRSSKQRRSILWKVPKKLKMRRLRITILKKIQKRSDCLIQIKRLSRVVKIEKAIRRLTRSVNKMTKPKDLAKISKEIKRLIKIKSGLIKLNKSFDKKLVKRARKAKTNRKKSELKKKKKASKRRTTIRAKQLNKVNKAKGKSKQVSTKPKVKKPTKTNVSPAGKNIADGKRTKSTEATTKLVKLKVKDSKMKFAADKSGIITKDSKQMAPEKKSGKKSSKKDTNSQKTVKTSPSKQTKVEKHRMKKSGSKTASKKKLKVVSSKKSKDKRPSRKVKTKVITSSCWKSKKTSKEIKRCIRKLHENFYTAKNKGVTQKEKARKCSRSERKIKAKKLRVRNLNLKIKHMQKMLQQHKNLKTLGRKQLLRFATNKRLTPVSVRRKSSKRSTNFKCLLMAQNFKTLKNLDCAHFRMIHDTQNVCVIKSPWGRITQIKSEKNKILSSKGAKPLKRLKSNYVECFRKVLGAKVTTMDSIRRVAKPFHLNTEKSFSDYKYTCTAICGTRSNGFGYFYCPNSTQTKIQKRRMNSNECSSMNILLLKKKANVSCRVKNNSKTSMLQSVLQRKQFPFEKIKLPPKQKSVLGIVHRNRHYHNAIKSIKKIRIPKVSADLIRSKTKKSGVNTGQKIPEKPNILKTAPDAHKRKRVEKLKITDKKVALLLTKTVMPSKRRVFCQKRIVPQRYSSQSLLKPSLKAVAKKMKKSRPKSNFVTAKKRQSYRWFLRRTSFLGQNTRFFLLKKPAVASKCRWFLRRKKVVGKAPRIFLVKKRLQKSPKLIALKSSFNQSIKLVVRESLVKKSKHSEPSVAKQRSRKLKRRFPKKKKIFLRKISGLRKRPRFVIKRKTVREITRRKEVLRQERKPRILIRKRREPGGRTRIVIFRESAPGKRKKLLKTKIYGPGIRPKVFVQKAIAPGQKPRIILATQNYSNLSFLEKQISFAYLKGKVKVPVIRRELSSGQVFRINKNSNGSLSVSKTKPKLFVQQDGNSKQKPIIIQRQWSYNNKIQYIISRSSFGGRPIRFVIQQGTKSQLMVIKKFVPGKEPEIIMRKVLVSTMKSKPLKTESTGKKIHFRPSPSKLPSLNINSNKMPVEARKNKSPIIVRKSVFNVPPPLVIINKPVAPGQKSQVLVRRDFIQKYNPQVMIRNPVPGQKPQVVMKTAFDIRNSNANKKQIISAQSVKTSRVKKYSKKRSYRIIPKRWSPFHYTKIFSRRQILSRTKKRVAKKKKITRKTFIIYAGRSRVITRGLLNRIRRRRFLNRRRKMAKYLKYSSKRRTSKYLRNKHKTTKSKRRLRAPIPSVSVRNSKTRKNKSKLQIGRKFRRGRNSSVCVLVKQIQPGKKPQIIIRRIPLRQSKIHKRIPKLAKRKGTESASYKRKNMLQKSGKKLISSPESNYRKKCLQFSGAKTKTGQLKKQKLQHIVKTTCDKSVEANFPDKSDDNVRGENKDQERLSTKQKIEMQKAEEILRTQTLKVPKATSGPEKINPAKRKLSNVIASPKTDKRASKKQRTAVNQTKLKKPLKRMTGNKKAIHKKQGRKRRKRKLHREFPHLLDAVANKLSAEYLKRAAKIKDKYKGKSVFKVPPVPPRKKGALPNKPESIKSKEGISKTFVAPKVKAPGNADIAAPDNAEFRKNAKDFSIKDGAPPIATVSTTEHISNWESHKERPKFLFDNNLGGAAAEEKRKAAFQSVKPSTSTFLRPQRPLSTGSILAVRKALCNILDSDAESFKAPEDTNVLTEAQKRIIEADIEGFPDSKANSRPKSPPEPIPAIWAVPKPSRFTKTTVTLLLEQIAQKNAARNSFGPMDTTGGDDGNGPEFLSTINDDFSDDEEENGLSSLRKENINSLMQRHPISNILSKSRFALKSTSAALSKMTTYKLLTELAPVPDYITKTEDPISNKEVAQESPPPRPSRMDSSGKQKLFTTQGTEIDSALTSPEDMDQDSNGMFMDDSPTELNNSCVFKEEPIFSIRESENDFVIESTTNVGTQFDKLIYRRASLEKCCKLPKSINLPPVLVRHNLSTFQKSVLRFKQNKILKIAIFARRRAQKRALRAKLMLKRASNILLKKRKEKLKRLIKMRQKNASKIASRSKRKQMKGKISKRVGKKKVFPAKTKSAISSKVANKSSTPKKVVLKSILKKPSFGMKKRRKVAPLKALPKDFVLKSILKKKKVNPSHPGVARESSRDAQVTEPLKTSKKKVVISSILSPVPTHSDRKHSRCKHFKGLKKKSKFACLSNYIRSSDSGKGSESSSVKSVRDVPSRSTSSSSVAGCSKDVGSALPRIQATSTVFKVPAIPPASAKVRVNPPAPSGSSSSKSSSAAASSSTYIAPQMPTSNDLSLSGILSGAFKVPETPPAIKPLKRQQPSSSNSHSSKRRKHSSSSTEKNQTSSSSPSNVLDHSPGYSSITLASLLKSSESPVSKGSTSFKPLHFDRPSKPGSQTDDKSKSESSENKLPALKHQDTTAEIKRISVPTKAQLKQVSPQPQYPGTKSSTETRGKIVDKNSKRSTPSGAVTSKSDKVNSKSKLSTAKDKTKPNSTEKAKPIPQKKSQLQTKKVSFDKTTSLIDITGKTKQAKLKGHAKPKVSRKGKKRTIKKKSKHGLRKCGHCKRTEKSTIITRSPAKKKKNKKLKKKILEVLKPGKKIQFPKIELKKLLRRKKRKGPKFTVKYTRPNSTSLSRTRLRVLISLYCKYEEQIEHINKIRRRQRILNPQQPLTKSICPIFQQELHYWKRVQRSKRFIRKLKLSEQKYFDGTKKIMAKTAFNKLSIAYNTSQLLARKVIKKYGRKRLLSRNPSKERKKVTLKGPLAQIVRSVARKSKSLRIAKRKSGKSEQKTGNATKVKAKQKIRKKVARKENEKSGTTEKDNENIPKVGKSVSKGTPKTSSKKVITAKGHKKLVKKKSPKPSQIKGPDTKSKKMSGISLKSKNIKRILGKGCFSQPLKKIGKTVRLLTHQSNVVAIPDENQMALSTIIVPRRGGENPNAEISKPFIVVSPGEMEKVNKIKKLIHGAENTGLVKDWLSYMASTFKKPQPPQLVLLNRKSVENLPRRSNLSLLIHDFSNKLRQIPSVLNPNASYIDYEVFKSQDINKKTDELITRVPTNCYIMHSIQLQRHKRELDDRIADLKEKGQAMRIGAMPKLPPVPKGFIEEETTPMTKETVETAITQRLCLSIAHGGFTHSNVNAVEALSLAVQRFYKNFCKNLKETVHRSNSHHSIGFPDAMDRVLTEKGFGGVRGLEDYYNTEVISRHKSLQNIAALKRVEYATILRNSIGLPPHVPVTPQDFAADGEVPMEPSADANAVVASTSARFREENKVASYYQGDKDILELIYELETDVLKSSQTVMSHEVLRPRFLEYQESSETPQRRLEILSVPISRPPPKVPAKVSKPARGKKQTESKVPQTSQEPDTKTMPKTAKMMVMSVLNKLTPLEKEMFQEWQKMALGMKLTTPAKSTITVLGKEFKTIGPISAEQSLFAKAIDLRANLAMRLKNPKLDQAGREKIIKEINPRIIHFLRMFEVARKVVLIARRVKLIHDSIKRAAARQTHFPRSILDPRARIIAGNRPPLYTPQQNNAPSTSHSIMPPPLAPGKAGSVRAVQKPATFVKPAPKVATPPGKPMSASMNRTQVKPTQVPSRDQKFPATPGTSRANAADSQLMKPPGSVKPVGLNQQGPIAKSPVTRPAEKTATKKIFPGKKAPSSLANRKERLRRLQLIRQRLQKRKEKTKASKKDNELQKEGRIINLYLRISSFIRRLPKATRVTALKRNPYLVRALGGQWKLGKVMKGNRRLATIIKSPWQRKLIFNRKTKYAKYMGLKKTQVKVFDRKSNNMKITMLRRNQWKSFNAKNKTKKITTLKRNRGIYRNPITKKRKIVTVETEKIQVTKIAKDKMKIVYPKSNEEKVVFMKPTPVKASPKLKAKTTSLKSHQTRITDVNRNVSNVIKSKRGTLLQSYTEHRVPSNKVTIFDKKTQKKKTVHLTVNQVATINAKTKKVKIRNLKSFEVKILDPISKKTRIVILQPNQIKSYDDKTNTVRITTVEQDKVLDPVTKKLTPLKLQANQVTLVNPKTKKVKIATLGKLKSVHSHAMNIDANKRLQKDCLRVDTAIKRKAMVLKTYKSLGRVPITQMKSRMAATKEAFVLKKVSKPGASSTPTTSILKRPSEAKRKVLAIRAKDPKRKITDKYLKISRKSRPGGNVSAAPPTAQKTVNPNESAGSKPNNFVSEKQVNPLPQIIDPKSDAAIRKPLVGEGVAKSVSVIPVHPSTSLLRPVNPNLPQFSKTSLIQIGPTSGTSKIGVAPTLPAREAGSSKNIAMSIPTMSPHDSKILYSKSGKLSVTARLIKPNEPMKMPRGVEIGNPSMVAYTSQKPKPPYPQDSIYNVKPGGLVSGTQLPGTPIHSLLTAPRLPQSLDQFSDTGPQHLKVAYRVPQASMAPIIPHSSLTIISSGKRALMFDTSKQSSVSQTKIAFSSSSLLGRPTPAESVMYTFSPTKEVRKPEKSPSKTSSSSSSSSSSKYPDSSSSSSSKSSKTSKGSSRSADSSKSSKSAKEKEKSSSRNSSSEGKVSSSSSSKHSTKHHDAKHSTSSSSKGHREASPVPKKSKHHKGQEVTSPEPKQPAKRGRPPKRPAPVTPPKKAKGSRHSPESTDDSGSSRKHAKYH